MDSKAFKELQVKSARDTLARRQDALEYSSDARRVGNHKEARFWEGQVRQLDKLIQQYGLERYAQRPQGNA
jgi:hypothetical protein